MILENLERLYNRMMFY